jgi:hypothetical protein
LSPAPFSRVALMTKRPPERAFTGHRQLGRHQ